MRRWRIRRDRALQMLSLAVIVCAMAGCSFFGQTTERIIVSSDPPGAQVIAEGKPVGARPHHFEAQRGKTLLIEVQKS